MNLRPRDSASIRVDALRMATKKISEGCTGCGESYIELARQHGATAAELAAARIHVSQFADTTRRIQTVDSNARDSSRIWTPRIRSASSKIAAVTASISAVSAAAVNSQAAFADAPKKRGLHPQPQTRKRVDFLRQVGKMLDWRTAFGLFLRDVNLDEDTQFAGGGRFAAGSIQLVGESQIVDGIDAVK